MHAPQPLGYRILSPFEGAKDAPLKEPLLLLRGLGRSSRFWLGFEDLLRVHGKVILIDLLGTGMSRSSLGRWSVQNHAQDVLHTLEQIGIRKLHIVSISFGSMVGLEVANQLGEDCRSIVCMATSANYTGEQRIKPGAIMAMASALRHRVPKNGLFARHIVSDRYLKKNPQLPRIWDAIYGTEGFSRLATVGQLVAAARFEGKQELLKLRAPALFIASKDDGLVHWKNSVIMAQTAPRGQLHLIDGAGHDLPTEIPEELAQTIIQFCRTHD